MGDFELPKVCSREDAALGIASATDYLIEKMESFRAGLKRTDPPALLMGVADTAVNSVKLLMGGNADFKRYAEGVPGKGAAFAVRVGSRALTETILKATDEQLRNLAKIARWFADMLDGITGDAPTLTVIRGGVPDETEAETVR